MSRFFTMLKISRGILPIWLVQLLFQCLMKMSCSATGNVLRITWISSWQAMSLTTWDARAGQRQFCSEKHRNHQMLNSLGAWVLSPNEVFKKTFISRKDHTISKSWVLQTGAFFSYVLSKHQDRDASGTVLWSLQRGWCMAQLCHVWFWLGACFACKDPQCLNLWTSRHHQVAPTVTMEQAAWVSFLQSIWVWWFWMEQKNQAAWLPGACHCQVDVGFHWLLRPGCCSTHHCHGGVSVLRWGKPSVQLGFVYVFESQNEFVSPNVLCWGVHQPKYMRTRGNMEVVGFHGETWGSNMGSSDIQRKHGRSTAANGSLPQDFLENFGESFCSLQLHQSSVYSHALWSAIEHLTRQCHHTWRCDDSYYRGVEVNAPWEASFPIQWTALISRKTRRNSAELRCIMLKLLSCHSWRQICPIELTLLSSMFFAGKTLIAC